MTPGELAEATTEYGNGATSSVWDGLERWTAALAARERVLWALVAVALVGDAVTTVAGIELGLAEGNPIVATVLAEVGVVGFLAMKWTVVLAGVSFRLLRPRFRVVVPLGLALPWLLATVVNLGLLATAI